MSVQVVAVRKDTFKEPLTFVGRHLLLSHPLGPTSTTSFYGGWGSHWVPSCTRNPEGSSWQSLQTILGPKNVILLRQCNARDYLGLVWQCPGAPGPHPMVLKDLWGYTQSCSDIEPGDRCLTL